ncbi:MAG: hypothetical protein BIFFINMI_04060 [Phycisphaerae bacterium]|nr:hypothetical protein [Phycisphaerae bacterium]
MAMGVVVSEATFRGRIGRSATLLGLLSAEMPDMDTLPGRFVHDPWFMMAFHRGLTHSFVMIPLLALLPAGLVWLFRRRQFRLMYAVACLAMLTHPVLDLVTTYGTQIFWPITNHRFAFDFLPIVDMFYTPILLLAIVACAVVRRAGTRHLCASEIRRERLARRIALAALVLSTGYMGVGFWADRQAQLLARRTVPADHGEALDVRCPPMIGNVFARRLAVRTPQGYYVSRHNLLTSTQPPQWNWAASASGPDVSAADRLPHIELFRWFTMDMARPVLDRETGGGDLVRITWYDMRYGYPADATESFFSAMVVMESGSDRVVYGPTRSRWSGRLPGQEPAGVLSQFAPPPGNPILRDRSIGTLWRESWRP